MRHSNGAVALTELILCCENPKAYVNKYERLANRTSVEIDDNYFTIDLGHSKIIVIAVQCLAEIVPIDAPPVIPFMAAFTVETSDLQLTKNVLLKNGIVFTERNGCVMANAVDGGGCAVIFKSR
jgi:hypothetical protein